MADTVHSSTYSIHKLYIDKNLKKSFVWSTCIAIQSYTLKVVSATFLQVCFVYLKERTCETRKNAFYFTSKAPFVL